MKKFLYIFGGILIIAGIGFFSYFRSFNTLTIKFSDKNQGVVVDVYNTGPDTVEETNQLNSKNLVAENISSEKTIRLKKGSYSVVARKNDNYEQFNQKVSLYQSNQTVTVESYYSEKNLSNKLGNEKNSIEASLVAAYPRITGQYIFENERLFHFGDWYGVTLKYVSTDTNNSDTLVAILKKEGNTWSVITKPPSQIVSTQEHPEIPIDIANAMNQKVY